MGLQRVKHDWETSSEGFPSGSAVKNLPSMLVTGDVGSIPGSGRSPGGGNGNPLQYSYLENPRAWGAWRARVQRVAKSRTRLSTRPHPGCLWLLVTYGEFGQANWTTEERPRLEIISPAIWGWNEMKHLHTRGDHTKSCEHEEGMNRCFLCRCIKWAH